MKPVSLVSVFQDIAMMKGLLLIPAFAQINEAFKLTNYGDLLQEIPDDYAASDNSRNQITSNPKMLKMSVKELLDMNHHYIQSSDYNSYYNKPFKADPYENRNSVYEEYYLDYPTTDTEKSSESFEAHMEEMLGKDFFEDKKFLLFVIFSCVLFLLVFSCSLVTLRWCWMSVCRAPAPPDLPALYTPLSLPSSPDTSLTMYSDVDTPYPDQIFLQGRKLYPGVLWNTFIQISAY